MKNYEKKIIFNKAPQCDAAIRKGIKNFPKYFVPIHTQTHTTDEY